MNQIKASQEDVTSVRNVLIFFVLSPIFFTFATVMCDFLNRDLTPDYREIFSMAEKQEICGIMCV